MPRLTNSQYLEIHHRLRRYWVDDPLPYARLTPNEQWDLHKFFRPYEALNDTELIQHRSVATEQSPSLPQRAGRAMKRFDAAIESTAQQRAEARTAKRRRGPSGPAVVWPLVQPEIDARRLARAFIALARIERDSREDV